MILYVRSMFLLNMAKFLKLKVLQVFIQKAENLDLTTSGIVYISLATIMFSKTAAGNLRS